MICDGLANRIGALTPFTVTFAPASDSGKGNAPALSVPVARPEPYAVASEPGASEFATPLAEFAALAASGSPCPTAHLYAQPRDDSYLSAQQAFAAEHDWFHVHRLSANSHFPCLEVPTESAAAISNFVAGVE